MGQELQPELSNSDHASFEMLIQGMPDLWRSIMEAEAQTDSLLDKNYS